MRATLAILTVLAISACGGERARPMGEADGGATCDPGSVLPMCAGETEMCPEGWVCYPTLRCEPAPCGDGAPDGSTCIRACAVGDAG